MIISNANLSDDKNITDTKENQSNNLCYIYRHIRLDRNEVFYIGKGTNTDGKYTRAYSDNRTNPHWHRVVNKYGYEIEIMLEELSEEEANEKEKEFIKLYGRRDLGTGTLVNMTNGGDGVIGAIRKPVSEETILKRKKSHLEKYGVENAFQSEEIKEKIKQTNLIRYGVENSFKCVDIRNKAKATNMKKYGVENCFQSDEIKEKIKQTNLEKYGVERPSQSEEIRNKVKATNFERLGVEYASQSPDVKDKVRQTNLNNHGVENVFQSDAIKEKSKQTNLEKYGYTSYTKTNECKEKIKATNLEKYGVTHYTKTAEYRERMSKQKSCKPVGKYKDGILIKEYPSMSSTRLDGFSSGKVSQCCNGKIKNHKGYEWEILQ